MKENDSLIKNKSTKRFYIETAVECGFGVYCGNLIKLFFGLTYMQSSALAGASIFPIMVGLIVGFSVYRILLKSPFIAEVSAKGVGVATYATIGSFLVQPINGNEALLISYSEHLKSFSEAMFVGIIYGILSVFLSLKDRLYKKVISMVNRKT